MKIGVDIDGVLTDESSFLKDFASKFFYENKIDYRLDPKFYDSKETLGVSKEEYMSFWENLLEVYATETSIRPFASEVLNILNKKGHEIYIITSRNWTREDSPRGVKMRTLVKTWLKENNVPYNEIYFATNKASLCKDLNIDYMIEDKPANILSISDITKVICYHDYCNQDIEGKNIIRCYSWYDILREIV